MRALRTTDELEAVVGTRPKAMMMKEIDSLDEGCIEILAQSAVAAVGFADTTGAPWATFIGSHPRAVGVNSPTELTLQLPPDGPMPPIGGSISIVHLLAGVGETLRTVGRVAAIAGSTVTVALVDAWIHCAKCIRRSGLWDHPADRPDPGSPTDVLGTPGTGALLAASPFAIVTSFDGAGHSDTSPRGDRPGFIQVLDGGRTIAVPDRKGNRRTDTFHNILERDDVALAAVVPGTFDVLHLRGRGYVTDDANLLTSMALNERPPHAALVVDLADARIVENTGIRDGRTWDVSAHVPEGAVPDLMALGAEHLARSKARGATAAATRILSRGLAATPRFFRRGVEHGYRKELEEEGFQ